MLTSLARRGGASLLAALAVSAASAQPPSSQTIQPVGGTAPAGTPVAIDGLKSLAPPAWVAEKADQAVRYQFRLQRQKGDTADATVTVTAGVGGTPDDHLNRWKSMFVPPPGMTAAEAARVTSYSVGQLQVTALDVQGTYIHKDRPPSMKVGNGVRPGQRMLAVVLKTSEGTHLICLFGPKATVGYYQKSFDQFVQAFR